MTNPLPPDLSDLWKALRAAWVVDPLLSQLIDQSASGGSIYLEMPHQKVPFPMLVMKILDPEINMEASYRGVSRQTLQINAYGLDRWLGGKIFAAFEANWTIPRLAAQFSSNDWYITEMNWMHPIDLGRLRVSNIDQDVWGFACHCRCFVRQVSS